MTPSCLLFAALAVYSATSDSKAGPLAESADWERISTLLAEVEELTAPTADWLPAEETVADLALGWGTSNIGPGILWNTPVAGLGTPGSGGGLGGRQRSGQPSTLSALATDPIPPTPNPTGNNPTGSGNPVPEPASVICWLTMLGLSCHRRRSAA